MITKVNYVFTELQQEINRAGHNVIYVKFSGDTQLLIINESMVVAFRILNKRLQIAQNISTSFPRNW